MVSLAVVGFGRLQPRNPARALSPTLPVFDDRMMFRATRKTILRTNETTI